jgi:group I intron endonuclease
VDNRGGYVYFIESDLTDAIYVGVTVDPAERWRKHRGDHRRAVHKPLYAAMDKHGFDAFRMVVFEHHATYEQACYSEMEWIDSLKVAGVRLYNCYASYAKSERALRNMSEAGQSKAVKVTAEAAVKISIALKGKPRPQWVRDKISAGQRGRPRTEEEQRASREHSERMRGRKLSDEHRQKISNGNKGHVVTDETREKIRRAHKSRQIT